MTGTVDASGGDGGNDGGCTEFPGMGSGGAGGGIQLASANTDVALATLLVTGGLGGTHTMGFPEAVPLQGGDASDGNIDIL